MTEVMSTDAAFEEEEQQATNSLLEAIEAAKQLLHENPTRTDVTRKSSIHPKTTAERTGAGTTGTGNKTAANADHQQQLETMRKAHQKKVAGLTAELKKMEKARDDSLSALERLRQEVEKIRAEELAKGELKLMQNIETLTTQENKINTLLLSEEKLKNAVMELGELNKKHLDQIKALEVTLGQSTDDERVNHLRAQISDLTAEAIQRERNLESRDQIIADLRKKYAEHAEALGSAAGELEALKNKSLTHDTDYKLIQQTLEAKAQTVSKLEAERIELKKTVVGAEEKFEQEQKEIQTQLETGRYSLETVRKELDLQKETVSSLKSALEKATKESIHLERKQKAIQGMAVLSFHRRDEDNTRLKFLHRWQSSFQQRVAFRDQLALADKDKALMVYQEDSKKRHEELTATLEELQRALQEKDGHVQTLKLKSTTTQDSMESQLVHLRERQEQAERVHEELLAMKETTQQNLEEQVHRLKEQLQATQERESASQQEVKFLQTQLDARVQEVQDENASAHEYWKGRVGDLERSEAALRSEVQQLKQTARSRTATPESVPLNPPPRGTSRTGTPEAVPLAPLPRATPPPLAEPVSTAGSAPSDEEAVLELRHAIDDLCARRTDDARTLQHFLKVLEETHRHSLSELEFQLEEALATSESHIEQKEGLLAKISELEKELDATQSAYSTAEAVRLKKRKSRTLLASKTNVLLNNRLKTAASRYFGLWHRFVFAQRAAELKRRAQRSLKVLQTKAESVRSIADEAVVRNSYLETRIRELEEELALSPRRVARKDNNAVDLLEAEAQTEGATELEEARTRAEHYAEKARELTRLMETARGQIHTVVQELRGFKEREGQFIDEVGKLNEQLSGKDVENTRLKVELRKALSRWTECSAIEQSEFANWLVVTRPSLVRDLVQLRQLAKEVGGTIEKGVTHIIYKYLTDPEKHHHGIGLISSPMWSPMEPQSSGALFTTPATSKRTPSPTPQPPSGAIRYDEPPE